MNLEGYEPAAIEIDRCAIEDRWILDRLDDTIARRDRRPRAFQFAEAARRLRDFTLGRVLRLVRRVHQGPAPRPARTRGPSPSACWRLVLDSLCRLLHPIMPFVTEQVWQALGQLAPSAWAARSRSPAEPERLHRRLARASRDRRRVPREATVAQWREKITGYPQPASRAERRPEAKIAPILVAEGDGGRAACARRSHS